MGRWAGYAVGVAMVLVTAGCGSGPPSSSSSSSRSSVPSAEPAGTRWVASYGTEVAVPAAWPFAYGVVRPDCIERDSEPADDTWARGIPTAPYVEIEPRLRAIPAIGCRPRLPADLPPAFGPLPFALWQPHVRLALPGPAGDASSIEGTWRYRGWTLTRRQVGEVLVSVLADPGRPDLGTEVLASAREVAVDANECSTTAPVQRAAPQQPTGAPIPAASEVSAVSVCEYARTDPSRPGLVGSRRITGSAAADLVRALRAAPAGGGPDRPRNCLADGHGDSALVLRFRTAAGDRAQAYVYYDWCVGNGFVDSAGRRALTPAACRPLFTEAPVRLWSAQSDVARICWTRG